MYGEKFLNEKSRVIQWCEQGPEADLAAEARKGDSVR